MVERTVAQFLLRLQKHFSRKVEDKEYSKYVVVIPRESVEKRGWKAGQKLEEKFKDADTSSNPKTKKTDALLCYPRADAFPRKKNARGEDK